jgi:Uncharacterized protein conserved in bacteria
MRWATAEERALFLAALSGRLPPKKPAVKSHKTADPAAEKKTAKRHRSNPALREVSEEELDLFLEAIGKRARSNKTPEPVVLPSLPVKAPRIRAGGGGLDGGTKRRLDKGEIAPTAKLDLHGMTESAAHGALLTFLHTAHRRGDRLVLIVTGKGPPGDGGRETKIRYRGVLRQMVPRWLEEAPMAAVIADKRWAHRRHGGDGALYVYLKKR